MPESIKILHEAKIANNCPECYNSNGLESTFSQIMRSNWLYNEVDPTLVANLYCNTCSNDIYPVNWTDDIERVYKYQLKIAEVEKEKSRIQLMGYLLIGAVILALIALGIYFSL